MELNEKLQDSCDIYKQQNKLIKKALGIYEESESSENVVEGENLSSFLSEGFSSSDSVGGTSEKIKENRIQVDQEKGYTFDDLMHSK